MRKATMAMAGALALAGCEAVPGGPMPQGGGVTGQPAEPGAMANQGCDVLVPILADDTAAGVARERAWLAENFPGYEILNESPGQCGDVPVDRVAFVHDGIQHTVVFDTSSFYGRVDGDDLDDLLDG